MKNIKSMKHLFWFLILLQITVLVFAQHSNNKKSINSMETKQKSLVAFSHELTRTMQWDI